jgi:hypothetical protein
MLSSAIHSLEFSSPIEKNSSVFISSSINTSLLV